MQADKQITRSDAAPAVFCRREFLGKVAVGGAMMAASAPLGALAAESGQQQPIVVFSKAFQQLSFEETADLVAEIGWNGIECPVRKGGQVLPEKVEEDLPRLVEALKKRGAAVHIMATDVRNATDPMSLKVLRTASKLGIKHYRYGPVRYDLNRPILPQIQEVKAQIKDVVALNRELGLVGAFQNHSGGSTLGGPVWDIFEIIRDFDREHCGICFDIGHATVAGGTDWQIHARLMEPYMHTVFVKDFGWEKGPSGWVTRWKPLGEGMISHKFFSWLKKIGFKGPISQHFEYDFGTGDAMRQAFKRDFAKLKQWLAA